MRRRDLLAACLLWGGLLAGLMWALNTQFRWVRENKPLRAPRLPGQEAEAPAPPPESATGVIGTVEEDTLRALGKGLKEQPKPSPKPPVKGKDTRRN